MFPANYIHHTDGSLQVAKPLTFSRSRQCAEQKKTAKTYASKKKNQASYTHAQDCSIHVMAFTSDSTKTSTFHTQNLTLCDMELISSRTARLFHSTPFISLCSPQMVM